MDNITLTFVNQVDAIERVALKLAKIAAKRWPKDEPKEEKPAPKLSDKGRRVVELAGAHFSEGHHKALGKLLAVILDDPAIEPALFPVPKERIVEMPAVEGIWDGREFAKGFALVPLANHNSHSYDIGKVAIMSGKNSKTGYCIHKNVLEVRNHMSSYKCDWRPATEAEIKAAMAGLRKAIKAIAAPAAGLPF